MTSLHFSATSLRFPPHCDQTRFLLIRMHRWASSSWTQIVFKVNFVRQFREGLKDINLIRGNRSGRFKNPPPPPAHFLIEKLSLWFITCVNIISGNKLWKISDIWIDNFLTDWLRGKMSGRRVKLKLCGVGIAVLLSSAEQSASS